jgi:hypothetical protein
MLFDPWYILNPRRDPPGVTRYSDTQLMVALMERDTIQKTIEDRVAARMQEAFVGKSLSEVSLDLVTGIVKSQLKDYLQGMSQGATFPQGKPGMTREEAKAISGIAHEWGEGVPDPTQHWMILGPQCQVCGITRLMKDVYPVDLLDCPGAPLPKGVVDIFDSRTP